MMEFRNFFCWTRHAILNGLSALIILIPCMEHSSAQTYPPEGALTFSPMPNNLPMPGYLVPFTDPVFRTNVTRLADAAHL